MWWKKYILLLLTVTVGTGARAQGLGWERLDSFGNPSSNNVGNLYGTFLAYQTSITVSANASTYFGYWAKYDLSGNLLWQRRGRGTAGGLRDARWRVGGGFVAATKATNNILGLVAIYHWFNSNGDTVHVLGRPSINIAHQATHTLSLGGRYYVGGGGDGSGLGQSPVALHYSLVCLDTAGRLRWQRQYPNPAIRLGPTAPAYVGGYAYLRQVLEAGPNRLLLLGDTQRDSANFQLYAVEVDTAGRPRRTRWVEPFGRRAFITMTSKANAIRLRDGSGYVLTGLAQIDSLGRNRSRGFVARLDTALRVVWRTLLPTPTVAGPPAPGIDVQPGQVRERADGGLTVLVTEQGGTGQRQRETEVDFIRLSAQGRVLGWASYCAQSCNQVNPSFWDYLPADSSIVVSGWGEQRDMVGRVLARPAWLARLGVPCRRYAVPAAPTAAIAAPAGAASGWALYPQPAHAGGWLRLAMPAGSGGAVELRLLDATGREVARLAATAGAGSERAVQLPAGLSPGLYGVRMRAAGAPMATQKLLVQAAE